MRTVAMTTENPCGPAAGFALRLLKDPDRLAEHLAGSRSRVPLTTNPDNMRASAAATVYQPDALRASHAAQNMDPQQMQRAPSAGAQPGDAVT